MKMRQAVASNPLRGVFLAALASCSQHRQVVAEPGLKTPPNGKDTHMTSVISDPLSSAAAKYDEAIARGWATQAQKADYLDQQAYYTANRVQIEQQYPNKFIAIVNRQVFAADEPEVSEYAAQSAYPGRQLLLTATPPKIIPIRLETGTKQP